MNMRVWQSVLSITRQLRRIGNAPCGWLSDSGKGVKELGGIFSRVERTARGLAIVLQGGRRVAWRVSQSVASLVVYVLNFPIEMIAIEQTDNAISLAMSNRSNVFSLDEQVNAVCDVYPNADRRMVADVLASWV